MYVLILELANKLNIEFDPSYIMQVACLASYNGLKNVNLDATALMCYFYVVSNIKKRYNKALEHLVNFFLTKLN